MLERPTTTEYAPFYAGYVSLVPETDVLPVLERQMEELRALAAAVPPGRETFRYAPEKWSVRELFGHVGDAERILGYRAFCISRGEQASLPGWDEKDYVASAGFDRRGLSELVAEFSWLREANLAVLRSLDGEGWQRRGTANNTAVSVRALAFILAGHLRHHVGILHARYGV